MGVASSLLDPNTLGWLIAEDTYHSFNIDKQADGHMKSLIGRNARFEVTQQLKDNFRAIESCASQSGTMLSKMR